MEKLSGAAAKRLQNGNGKRGKGTPPGRGGVFSWEGIWKFRRGPSPKSRLPSPGFYPQQTLEPQKVSPAYHPEQQPQGAQGQKVAKRWK